MSEQTICHNLQPLLHARDPQPTCHSVQQVFGFAMSLPGFEPGHPLVPEATPGYVWDPVWRKILSNGLPTRIPIPSGFPARPGAAKPRR